jgi:hydrogenase maturation protein HypF
VVVAKSGSAEPTSDLSSSSSFPEIRRQLHAGAIVGVKGLGGFQFACDATNDVAVEKLRRRKKRSDKPFALMVRDVSGIQQMVEASAPDLELLLTAARPIVIMRRKPEAIISSHVAPGSETLGIMVANTPLHYLLFAEPNAPPEFMALVMTSGNLSDEPIVTVNERASQDLGTVADLFLFHNRDIYMRVDDSVTRNFAGHGRVLRRSRGYAPRPIDLGHPMSEVLACGAELKNTFCLTKGDYAILSQHIGDLENYETLEFFNETLGNLKKLFRVDPQAVAHDLHPQYMSSRLAATLPLPKIGVQHHHAHIASCMAENGLHEKVIGVALDGTGYGLDGHIWGGEFLVADLCSFERRAHFRYTAMPGGDAAVRQPWRMALSLLRESFGSELPQGLPWFGEVPEHEANLVTQMLARGVNTSLTSSCGRLFDAVASLVGIRHEVTFEGQAAIELEAAAQSGVTDSYSFEIASGLPAQIDMRPSIREIVRDLENGQSRNVIAARFHNTIAAVISEICERVRLSEHLNRVCLSGGTFQNVYLAEHALAALSQRGFEVFLHSEVPPNDGGIALGQAVIANEIMKMGA